MGVAFSYSDYTESRAVEHTYMSWVRGSVQAGHDHEQIYRQPQKMAEALIASGVFPEDAYLGVLELHGDPNFKRAAFNVPLIFVANNERMIHQVLFEQGLDPKEATNVLLNGSVIAHTHGYDTITSPVSRKLVQFLFGCPYTMSKKLVQSRKAKLRILGVSLD